MNENLTPLPIMALFVLMENKIQENVVQSLKVHNIVIVMSIYQITCIHPH